MIENFRPGVMKRLGLDYDALSKTAPALVYCALSGFGQEARSRFARPTTRSFKACPESCV